jgi:hypothetical protein
MVCPMGAFLLLHIWHRDIEAAPIPTVYSGLHAPAFAGDHAEAGRLDLPNGSGRSGHYAPFF